jgi:serine/threonine-protein kinase
LTTQSDIYSLGLVLYEIFTGKQAFEAGTLNELIRKHKTAAPTTPSEYVKEIDPLVERTILRCLEKDPRERPASAMQVALMLPGGNPLEAAIAAGETPSPEMVAAAPKRGALKPAVAVACLAAVILLFAFIVFFAGRVKGHEWAPLEKSPEVLAERADSIVKKLGYTNAPVDTDYGFANNEDDYPRYARAEKSPNRWERLRSGQPAMIYFWHRTSPRYLEPQRWEYSSVWHDDPPNDVAGMTKVFLDARGRLLEFQAVPQQVKDKTAQPGEVDWAALFTEAGLDIRNYRQTESSWTPPVFADANLSWEGAHVDHAEIPVRIEAAAYQGKPVYFQIVAPWDKPLRQEETFSTARRRAAGVILILIFLCVVVAAVFLARRNLRRGSSDTKGAFKTSIFVFLVGLAANLLYADHVPDLSRELSLLIKMVGNALFEAALIGLVYLALEPYVRRRWASLIISWNRLLVGDWRDPLVGRDILVGGLLGLGHTFAIYSAILSLDWSGFKAAPDFDVFVSTLQSFKHLWANFLTTTASAIFPAFFVLLFLVLLVTIFRKQWLATAVFWALNFLILFLAFGGEEGQAYHVFFTALIPTLVVVCIARFGLLAMVSFMVFFHLSFHNAITANVSNWYFGNTIFSAVVLLGLAIYGFYTSLAGQPLLKGKLLED